jgi:hypothetical protein
MSQWAMVAAKVANMDKGWQPKGDAGEQNQADRRYPELAK